MYEGDVTGRKPHHLNTSKYTTTQTYTFQKDDVTKQDKARQGKVFIHDHDLCLSLCVWLRPSLACLKQLITYDEREEKMENHDIISLDTLDRCITELTNLMKDVKKLSSEAETTYIALNNLKNEINMVKNGYMIDTAGFAHSLDF